MSGFQSKEVTRLLGGGPIEIGELTPWATRTRGFSSYLDGTGGLPTSSLESEEMKKNIMFPRPLDPSTPLEAP